MRLTDITIQKLLPPDRGQKLHPDDTLPGFGVRVSQGGSKSFVLTVGPDRQRITIGRYPVISLAQAREKAKTLLAQRHLGVVKKPTPTFKAALGEYLSSRDEWVSKATRRGDGYLFKLFATFAAKKLGDITPQDIQAILDDIDAPTTRHHALLRLRGLFRFAERHGYVDSSPVNRFDAPKVVAERDRVLSDSELARILSTARIWGYPFGTIVSLLVYTGQRRQQIGSLERSFIDFGASTIAWPAELMKTGRRHVIPLGDLPRSILEPIKAKALYFPNRNDGPFCGWSYHVRRFKTDVGFGDWVLHDIRRTLATRWQEMGIEIATTEKMLSHSAITGGLVGIYQRSSYLGQMRSAVQLWDNYLQAFL